MLKGSGKIWRMVWLSMMVCAGTTATTAQEPLPVAPTLPAELQHGRELLKANQPKEAQAVFEGYLRTHPGAVQAELGLGDAELAQHQYETAELTYRAIVAREPQLWEAHKNLVVVEAALGRWDEFDRERTVLRMARERGAPGISTRESDVIDTFTVDGARWVVRAYFEPVGRSEARYNFERFRPDGRVQAYVSLEDAAAAAAALQPGDVRVGAKQGGAAANSQQGMLALNWYTGTAHGNIRNYPAGEPPYRQLRADVQHWIRAHQGLSGSGPKQSDTMHGKARPH